jgi:hypothetical protein
MAIVLNAPDLLDLLRVTRLTRRQASLPRLNPR